MYLKADIGGTITSRYERTLSCTHYPSPVEAVSVFCGILGVVAGNLALTLGARGGVFIGGVIVPRLGAYFADSSFRCRFEDHGHFSRYLSAIPISVITALYPALIAAAVALKPEYRQLGVTTTAA